MKQKFNLTVKWQTTTFDGGPSKEKRQISLASGDYPDLYLLIPWVDQFTHGGAAEAGNQGVVVPLNELIDQYAPNIKKALDATPEWKAMATAPDGKIYGMPQWVDCFHCSYPDKLWMNSAWLKKLGLEQPKTTEDLRKVLQAFKTQDPNGNGKADEIPISANVRDSLIPYFMNAFIYDPQGQNNSGGNNTTLVLNNGKVDVQANKDGWREGLRYINSLYTGRPDRQGRLHAEPGRDAAAGQPRRLGHPRRGHRHALGHLRHRRFGGRAGQAVRRGTAADRSEWRELRRLRLPEHSRRHVRPDVEGDTGEADPGDQDARLHLHRRGPEQRAVRLRGQGLDQARSR